MNNTFSVIFISALVPFTIARCYAWSLLSEIQRFSNLDKEKYKYLFRSIPMTRLTREDREKLLNSCPDKALVKKYTNASTISMIIWGFAMGLMIIGFITA